MRIGFDNEKYQRIQSEHIKERISQFDGKLYLELGGKLFDDHHASRVLPGFLPDSKLRMFQKISDSIEIVIVISAADIEKNKKRADLGITYDEDVLRLRGEFQNRGFMVGSVVITHYNGQPAATQFKQRLERDGCQTYSKATHTMSSSLLRTRALAKMTMLKPSVRWLLSPPPAPAVAKWLFASANYIMRTNAASEPDMPNLRPSPYGTCHSSTRSTLPTKPPLPTSTTST